jgi:hypothetical protein
MAALALALVACGPVAGEDAETSAAAVTESGPKYTVRLGGQYDFCLAPIAPAPNPDLAESFDEMPLPNLDNVRALGHLSDVAYWDPTKIGPELDRLGFGKPGEGRLMAQCAADAANVRSSTATDPLAASSLGECARNWRERNPQRSAKDFLTFVEGETHPGRTLEFFSTGYRVGSSGQEVSGHTQVVWAQHRTEPWVVVSFRGTEFLDGGSDLWTDASFPTVPFRSGWGNVHGGFASAYRTVSRLLDERLAKLPRGTHVWVTGHSLGGALASLFSADLLARMESGDALRFDGLVTFGSPRVGDTAFFQRAESVAAKHKAGLHRVQNVSASFLEYDPIVHVPFRSSFGADFGHVGAPLQIYDDGSVDYGNASARLGLPDDLVPAAIASFKRKLLDGLTSTFPHFLARYAERVDRVLRSGNYPEFRQCGARRPAMTNP